MSSKGDAAPLEQDHPRVERREHKVMDSKQPLPKFNSNLLNKAGQTLHRTLDEDKCSSTSDRSAKGLSPTLFFEKAVSKSAAEIGEVVETGDYPVLDINYFHWFQPSHPNADKLSPHEKARVEELYITVRHHRSAAQQLEELLDNLQSVDSET